MKAIAIADLHIDINNRFEDTKAVLRQIVTYAVKNQVSQVWILGDIYDKKRPCSSEIVLFHQFVKSLIDHQIVVEMISGNHDVDRHQVSTLQELAVWDLPYVSLHANPFVIDTGFSKIYLGHFLVTGAKLGTLDYSARAEMSIEKILETPADLYLLGDVHKAQKLHANPDVLYVGSPERIDFGERDEIKGFTLINLPVESRDKLSYKFIPLKTRPMTQFDLTVAELVDESVCFALSAVEDAIIKVKITCTKEEYRNIDEKELRNHFKQAQSLKIEYNIIRENRVRNANISESTSPDTAFINYSQEIELDADTTDLGLKIIREI